VYFNTIRDIVNVLKRKYSNWDADFLFELARDMWQSEIRFEEEMWEEKLILSWLEGYKTEKEREENSNL